MIAARPARGNVMGERSGVASSAAAQNGHFDSVWRT
jgi:hypothetical protein